MELPALMFNPKTTIPSLLGATFALTGCGGDPPPQPTSMWGASLEAFCMKKKDCSPTPVYNPFRRGYEDEFCREDAVYADFAAQYLSAECDALFASYYNCLTGLSCDVLLRGNEDDITSEELACVEEIEKDYTFALSCVSMLPRDLF